MATSGPPASCSSRKSKYSSLWLVLPLGAASLLEFPPDRLFREECLEKPSRPIAPAVARLNTSPSSEDPPDAVRRCARAL